MVVAFEPPLAACGKRVSGNPVPVGSGWVPIHRACMLERSWVRAGTEGNFPDAPTKNVPRATSDMVRGQAPVSSDYLQDAV